MSFYYTTEKSVEAAEEGVDLGLNENFKSTLYAATIAGIIKRYANKLRKDKNLSFEDLKTQIKTLCDAAIEGGDLTGSAANSILTSIDDARFAPNSRSAMCDTIEQICCDEFNAVAEISDADASAFEALNVAREAYLNAKKDVINAYLPIIKKYSDLFMDRYGKLLSKESVEPID